MCGINGLIVKRREDLSATLSQMNRAILHRGPDEDGFFHESSDDYTVAMAMRRLAIIDLSGGQQPMYSADRSIAIVFNGEIYNFKELRAALEADGAVFHTHCDTEVILRLYEKHGTDAFGKLDGMFAFSIFDRNAGKVVIARDFFGEKPLYYSSRDGRFVWASELKSLIPTLSQRPAIDHEALNLYFRLTYIPAPYTIYEGVHKLEANHFLTIDLHTLDVLISPIEHTFKSYGTVSKPDAVRMTEQLVRESVGSRSIADVRLGTFLSGGVDSSIVSLCLAQQSTLPIETFSIGFEKKSFDETDKSRLVAAQINSNHHEFIVSEQDLKHDRDAILLNFDEPFADSSALPTYLVAHKTRAHVTVALTGDGGDEMFGGYNKYYMGRLNRQYTSIMPKALHKALASPVDALLRTRDDHRGKRFKAAKLLKSIDYDGDFYYNIIALGFQEEEVRKLLRAGFFKADPMRPYKQKRGGKASSLIDFRNIDRLLSLEGDMLVKVDRTSMLTSLECRAPFLNKEIWNFTTQLPEDYLLHGWDKKHLLKEAFKDQFPDGFLNKSKNGFGVPVGDWLRSELRTELLSYIDRDLIDRQGLFVFATIDKLVRQHLDGKVDNTFRVWTFYCFQKWYHHHYDKA